MKQVILGIITFFLVSSSWARKGGRISDRVEERRRKLQDLTPAWIEVTPKAPIDPRRDSCFVMVQGKAYLVGGNGPQEAVNIYDPLQRLWEAPGPAPPVPIHHMQCVVADKKIWIVSAWIGEYTSVIKDAPDIYVFDTVTKKWSTKVGLPEGRRRGAAASVLVGRTIFVSHGIRAPSADATQRSATTGWLDYYDIDQDKWYTNLPDAPNPRDHTGGALIKSRICVAGGRNSGNAFENVLPTDCYDPVTKTWSVEASIPKGRANSAYGTTCDGKLLVAGGRGGNNVLPTARGKGGDDILTGGDGKSRVVGKGGGDDILTGGGDDRVWTDVQVFDGTTWTTLSSLRVPRYGTGLAVDCGSRAPGLPAQTCVDGAGNKVECLRLPGGTGLMSDDCNKQTHIAGGSSTPAGDVELLSVETLFPYGVDLRCFP